MNNERLTYEEAVKFATDPNWRPILEALVKHPECLPEITKLVEELGEK